MKRLYKYKILDRHTLRPIKVGSEKAWSKLQLRDILADEFPNIPKKNIIVWNPDKDPEPLV